MTVSVIKLPSSLGVGAQVTFTDSTAKPVSESGNTSRKSLRGIKRNYTCAVSPDDALEVQKIVMAIRGSRWPLAISDPFGNSFSNDLLDIDASGKALLGRRWTPATGSLEFFQRVMIPDGAIVFELNGSPATPTVNDYGVVDFGVTLTPGSDEPVAVGGKYLTPVCLMDNVSATAMGAMGGTLVYQFSDIRLEEIFETEFRALTA
jgi:hypothetical protein